MVRGRPALADHAQGAHLRARPAASWPHPRPRCRSSSAACATGTTASAGCATPRLTLLALINAGYYDEARAWRDWLLRAVAGSPAQLQIMYGLAGERRLTEWEVPWLPGYEGARPVRIGNGAHGQLQLDVYGEVMDALHQARLAGLAADEAGWALQRALLEHLEAVWREPDEGIWEVRGGRRHFTFSKVMAWVAFDRAVQERRGIRARRPGRALAPAARRDPRRGLPPRLRPRTRTPSSRPMARRQLDASLLLLPIVGFLPPDDPRMRGTVAAIERHLLVDGLVLRYDTAEVRRRAACRRGRLPRLQLLAGRRLCHARPRRRRAAAVRAPARAAQRCRPAGGGVRPARAAPGRQLPAGLLACGPGQHGAQPDPERQPADQRSESASMATA